MLRLKLLSIFFFALGMNIYANRSHATGEYKYISRMEKHESRDAAEKRIEIEAQIKYLEDRYGRVISQNNFTRTENSQSGSSNNSRINFNSLSQSKVKGEWVKNKDGYPKFKTSQRGDDIWIEVVINGYTRELNALAISFEAFVSDCPRMECKKTDFKDNSPFYMFFQAPNDGYLAIYLEDSYLEESFLLLPSGEIEGSNVQVKGDQQYIIFASEKDEKPKVKVLGDGLVDELVLSLEPKRQTENYNVKVLFSEKEFKKPITENKSKELNANYNISGQSEFPKSLKLNEFRKWIMNLNAVNEHLEILDIPISLSK